MAATRPGPQGIHSLQVPPTWSSQEASPCKDLGCLPSPLSPQEMGRASLGMW